MPNILFASNNISHWPNSVAGSVSGTFDSARVPYSIAMSHNETLGSPVFAPAIGSDTWFHVRVFVSSYDYNASAKILEGYDVNGVLLFSLRKKNQSHYASKITLYDGNSSITVNSVIDLTEAKINAVDVHYSASVLGISCKLYINSALAASTSFAANPNGYGSPTSLLLGVAYAASINDTQHMSEIIVADGDTRNSRLDLLRPLAAGAYIDWVGSLAALADDDPTTGMTTIAPLKRQTVTLTPYSGAANISNFVIVSQTTRGLNSPTQLKHTIRLAGVNYDSAAIPIGHPLQYNITDYQINPGTSLPWVGADLNTIETGFLSVA